MMARLTSKHTPGLLYHPFYSPAFKCFILTQAETGNRGKAKSREGHVHFVQHYVQDGDEPVSFSAAQLPRNRIWATLGCSFPLALLCETVPQGAWVGLVRIQGGGLYLPHLLLLMTCLLLPAHQRWAEEPSPGPEDDLRLPRQPPEREHERLLQRGVQQRAVAEAGRLPVPRPL